MKLVADSGSTKTAWRLISIEGKIQAFQTSGINPFYSDTQEISMMLKSEIAMISPPINAEQVSELFYYGAGCSTPVKIDTVKNALAQNFLRAEISVDTDLLGAARALCGNYEGIACIFGTGSNSCYYDGKTIKQNLPSYGFMFGDYGSGAHIGKTLIQHWADNTLPEDLKRNFEARQGNTREQILDKVYRQPLPNRFLASYSKFVFQNLSHPFMSELVRSCFRKFFESQLTAYPGNVPVNAVGSVAYYYHRIFEEVAEERNFRIGKILESPIAALALYHAPEID
jgi:glucosamine kinase